jgi:peptidoglycan-N-acetylglucosamine deacetylase
MKRTINIFLSLFLISIIFSCSPKIMAPQKTIALTFDDGPDSIYTGQVLDVLKSKNVKATFFLMGSSIEPQGDVVRRIHDEGHCLGNHAYHHLNFWNLKPVDVVDKEIVPTNDLIFKLTGIRPCLYRPPFGFMYEGFEGYFTSKGYHVVKWNIDPKDYEPDSTSRKIADFVINNAKDRSIILLHCGNGDRSRTVNALPDIISRLKKQNYRFIRVDELLGVPESL